MIQETRVYSSQFPFQDLYAVGRVLNVGSNNDAVGVRHHPGGVNIDLHAIDAHTQRANPIHAQADARALPFKGTFDSVILGELLEHMEREDGVTALRQAKKALKPGGRLIVTIPHEKQEKGPEEQVYYAPGIFAYHHRLISKGEILGWITEAGFRLILWAKIVYPWGSFGSGVVAC